MPTYPQGNPTEWDGKKAGHQSSQGNQQKGYISAGDIPILAHKCHCICPKAKVGAIPQRGVPCITRKEIPSRCSASKEQTEDRDRNHRWIGKEQRKRNGENERRQKHTNFEHFHCFLPWGSPNKP